MTRRRRTRVLILGDAELRRVLADEVRAASPVETVQPPRFGLVLLTVRESARRTLFHSGEVLVTEAKARVAGVTGLGVLQGTDEQAALDLAVIDAACNAGLAVVGGWHDRLEAAEAALEARLDAEQSRLAATRVEFETLDTAGGR